NRYPDVAETGLNPFYHFLTVGRAEGRGATRLSAGEPTFDAFCQILGRAPGEVALDLVRRRRDLLTRLDGGVLGEMAARAGELEPLIQQARGAATFVGLTPFHSGGPEHIVAMDGLQAAAARRRARAVVVTRTSELRGSARVAGHLATALAG